MSALLYVCLHHEKLRLVLIFFKVSVDQLFDNPESGKSLEFWILKSIRAQP